MKIDFLMKLTDEYFEEQRFMDNFKKWYYINEVPKIRERIKKFKQEMGHKDKDGEITFDMIARAREYPLEVLAEAMGQEMILCPFHADKNPSMDIRNNFFYCYGCGAKGDIIEFVMKRDGLTFKEAIRRLQ